MGKMRIIGVTGGCGTGKSTVASMLARRGGQVIDADRLARELQMPGAAAYLEIIGWLGESFLLPDRTLDRRKIAALVFEDREALHKLNRIMHERVAEEIRRRIRAIEEQEENKEGFIVLDVPLPVEKGFLDTADVIWAVVANDDIRAERLMSRMRISREEAESRIASQIPNRQYEEIADVVIENEKGLEELERKVEEALS